MDTQRRRGIRGDLGIVGVGAIAEAIITGLSRAAPGGQAGSPLATRPSTSSTATRP
jgi:hypothetical protein